MNAAEFRSQMAALPPPPTDSKPPHWDFWRRNLWELAQKEPPEKFMGWPCIYHTMLVNHFPMLEQLYQLQRDLPRWEKVMLTPNVGEPMDAIEGYATPIVYSLNMINQAYHLKLWEDTTGRRIDSLTSIYEFGGGFGAMALACHRLGFRGDYVIYDLPEFALLQKWFLAQHGIEVEHRTETIGAIGADLFIALYSLSETPPPFRARFMDATWARSYLFLYSPRFAEWNNHEWFMRFVEDQRSLRWEWSEIHGRPDHYLIGWHDAR